MRLRSTWIFTGAPGTQWPEVRLGPSARVLIGKLKKLISLISRRGALKTFALVHRETNDVNYAQQNIPPQLPRRTASRCRT